MSSNWWIINQSINQPTKQCVRPLTTVKFPNRGALCRFRALEHTIVVLFWLSSFPTLISFYSNLFCYVFFHTCSSFGWNQQKSMHFECSICLSALPPDGHGYSSVKCGHVFHTTCLLAWLKVCSILENRFFVSCFAKSWYFYPWNITNNISPWLSETPDSFEF